MRHVYVDRHRLTLHSLTYDSAEAVFTVAIPHWSREGGGHRLLQAVARRPDLAVLLTRCGQLILRNIYKSDATRCQILRLKCIKFDSAGASPQTPLESLQRFPDPLAVFKGAYF